MSYIPNRLYWVVKTTIETSRISRENRKSEEVAFIAGRLN